MSYLVSLLGARMHYAVPRLLHTAGRLERLYTDIYAGAGWPSWWLRLPAVCQPATVARLRGRIPDGIPADRITAFNRLGLSYAWRRSRAWTAGERKRVFLWANQTFCEMVCRHDWGAASGVFTFNCAGLEILQSARREGLRTVMEQTIAPNRLEERLLGEERGLHPGWEAQVAEAPAAAYWEREEAEWPLADLILCGSEFVKQGIAECGGPVGRCIVVPYGVEAQQENQKAEIRKQKSDEWAERRETKVEGVEAGKRLLRVLTVGTVGLRKGAPYLLEAAKRLKGLAEFRLVGPIGVLPEAEKELRAHLELIGPVPRSEVGRHYAWADVFVLPSICEGSATVTYEALAAGLPVICTPNTGSVVRDGADGFIVPIRDVDVLSSRLEALAKDAGLCNRMSSAARENARQNDLSAYAQRLLNALDAF